jgi:hypothetical protein
MIVGKAGTYLVEPSDGPLLGRLLALPTNIIFGSKGLSGTNTLAYCKEKSFYF